MPTRFDHQLTEATHLTTNSMVDIYKVGGGTLGNAYIGLWGYRVRRHGKVIASGEDLRTGMPVTHEQAAELACEITTSDAAAQAQA